MTCTYVPLADFDNYRRRVEKDVAGAVERGKRSLILAFLEVVDSFDRALLQVGNAAEPLVEGLEAVHQKDSGITRSARCYSL